jgi:uncharacterized membrane protein
MAVTIGIVNHEHETVSYRIGITVDSVENREISAGKLTHKGKWQEIVSFIPDKSGDNQKVEFWLFKNSETEPYIKDPLCLVIDVLEP